MDELENKPEGNLPESGLSEGAESKTISFGQMIMDDYMLLMFLGVTIYAVFYLIWGIMEISNVSPIPEALKQQILK